VRNTSNVCVSVQQRWAKKQQPLVYGLASNESPPSLSSSDKLSVTQCHYVDTVSCTELKQTYKQKFASKQ